MPCAEARWALVLLLPSQGGEGWMMLPLVFAEARDWGPSLSAGVEAIRLLRQLKPLPSHPHKYTVQSQVQRCPSAPCTWRHGAQVQGGYRACWEQRLTARIPLLCAHHAEQGWLALPWKPSSPWNVHRSPSLRTGADSKWRLTPQTLNPEPNVHAAAVSKGKLKQRRRAVRALHSHTTHILSTLKTDENEMLRGAAGRMHLLYFRTLSPKNKSPESWRYLRPPLSIKTPLL